MLQGLLWAALYWFPQFFQCSNVKRKRQVGMKDNPDNCRYNIVNVETDEVM